MATRQETKGNTSKDTSEALPPIDDDVQLDPPQPAPVEHTQAQEEDGEDLPPRRRADAARDAIAARFKELQQQERIERGEIEPPPDEGGELGAAAPQEGGLQDAGPSASEAEDDPEMELIVFGEIYKIKRSALVKHYDLEGFDDARIINIAQKQMAADQRLAEAKQAADQRLAEAGVRARASEVGDGTPTDQSAEPRPDDADGLPHDRPPQAQNQGFNEEKLDEIVQRVQFGDGDEAKQALRDFAGEIRRGLPTATPEEVLNQFEQRLAQRQHQTEIFEALKTFGEANPDIVKDKHLTLTGLDIAAELMVEDLKGIGIAEEYIRPLLVGDPLTVRQSIAAAHRAVRLQGHKVRSIDQVLADAAGFMRNKYHLPQPGTGSSQPHQPATSPGQTRERLHRKEIAQQQPRHGGVRAGAPQVSSRPKTALEIINEKRRAQGFPTHG